MEIKHLHHDTHYTYRLHSQEFNIVPSCVFFTAVPFADVFYLESEFLTFNKKYWSKLQLMKRENTRAYMTSQQISLNITLYVFTETHRKISKTFRKQISK